LAAALALFAGTAAADDRIVTKDGKEYKGRVLFFNEAQYWIETGGKEVEQVNISDIAKLELEPKAPDTDPNSTRKETAP